MADVIEMKESRVMKDDNNNNENENNNNNKTTRTPTFKKNVRQKWVSARKQVTEHNRKSTVDKWVSLTRTISQGVGDFLAGVEENKHEEDEEEEDDEEEDEEDGRVERMEEVWRARAQRLHRKSFLFRSRSKHHQQQHHHPKVQRPQHPNVFFDSINSSSSWRGKCIKSSHLTSHPLQGEEGCDDDDRTWVCRTPSASMATKQFSFPQSHRSRQASQISSASNGKRASRPHPAPRNVKDSVFKIAVDGIKSLTRRTTLTTADEVTFPKRSFAPSSRTRQQQASVGIDEDDVENDFFQLQEPANKRGKKDTTNNNLLNTNTTTNQHKDSTNTATTTTQHDNSTEDIANTQDDTTDTDTQTFRVYFDTDNLSHDNISREKDALKGILKKIKKMGDNEEDKEPKNIDPKTKDYENDDDILRGGKTGEDDQLIGRGVFKDKKTKYKKKEDVGWGGRLDDGFIKDIKVNSSRRHMGIGVVGDILGLDYRESRIDTDMLKEMAMMQDCRPYFTYWVTCVQLLVYIFIIAVYGFSQIGFSEYIVEEEVRMPSLAIEKVHYFEQSNMWIGPRQADLIHLGAKYSPCMRTDINVFNRLEERRAVERSTGCCVYNDMSGCVQLSRKDCPQTLATWLNGTVCGQDPAYCKRSVMLSSLWPEDDITQWPICEESSVAEGASGPTHMTCVLVGRPCCVGTHGYCIITTPDYCEFRRGYFHPEATLCSQVKTCLSDICGMLPFYYPSHPNHFYRLWTSLFLHAGILQLLVTVVFQFLVMRDIEYLLGWWRIGLVYMVSGIGGSLASSIFVPYHVEAGPSGSQFGILACMFVEVIQSWKVLTSPGAAILKLSSILVLLFLIGLFPWVDNYAHLFGFMFGFLASFVLMPYVNFNVLGRKGRIVSAIVCLLLLVAMMLSLLLLFYNFPISRCKNCHLFNCIPFTSSFCKATEVKLPDDNEH